MQPSVQKLFSKLEKQREFYTQLLSTQPTAVLQRKPAQEKWSAAQVFYHLWMVDNLVVSALAYQLKTDRLFLPQTLRTRFRSALLNTLLRLPIKFKAPKQVADIPALVDINQVDKQWKETRIQLQQILEDFPTDQLNKEIFKHPRVGMLTLPQTLAFVFEHHAHHEKQLKQLLSA